MRYFQCLAVFLLFAICASAFGANYDIVIDESGNAFVLGTFTGNGALRVPIPAGTEDFVVKGALYAKHNDSITLSLSNDTVAIVSYTSASLTQKTGNQWTFSFQTPEGLSNAVISVSLPEGASILVMNPEYGTISQEADSTVLTWPSWGYGTSASLVYKLRGPGDGTNGHPEGGGMDWPVIVFVLGGVLLLALLAIAAFFFLKRKSEAQKKPRVEATEGMRNVLKTLGDNDTKIVEAVLEAGGEMKRSELERKLEMAKSSLALALDRLEEKNILKLDRETTAHRVRVSEWFRSL